VPTDTRMARAGDVTSDGVVGAWLATLMSTRYSEAASSVLLVISSVTSASDHPKVEPTAACDIPMLLRLRPLSSEEEDDVRREGGPLDEQRATSGRCGLCGATAAPPTSQAKIRSCMKRRSEASDRRVNPKTPSAAAREWPGRQTELASRGGASYSKGVDYTAVGVARGGDNDSMCRRCFGALCRLSDCPDG